MEVAPRYLERADAVTDMVGHDRCLNQTGPGTRLGSYEVTALIGQGGMGEVYRWHSGW